MLAHNKELVTVDCVGIGHNIAERHYGCRLPVRISKVSTYKIFPLFKYLRSEDEHYFFDEETIKIVGANTYGDLASNSGVGDPYEKNLGNMKCLISDSQSEADQKAIENLHATGLLRIETDSKTGATPTDINIEHVFNDTPNFPVICFGKNYHKKTMKRWNEALDAKYNSCLVINDAVEFVRLLQRADKNAENRLGGHAIIDEVQYVDFPLNAHNVDVTYFSFLKDRSKFGWQNEIRISWPGIFPNNHEPYYLHVPNISKLINRVKF